MASEGEALSDINNLRPLQKAQDRLSKNHIPHQEWRWLSSLGFPSQARKLDKVLRGPSGQTTSWIHSVDQVWCISQPMCPHILCVATHQTCQKSTMSFPD